MSYRQDWNQTKYWVYLDGSEIEVNKLSKNQVLQIVFGTSMLVSKQPSTLTVYQSNLWTAIASRAKELTDTSKTVRTGPLAKRTFYPARIEGMQ